MPQLDFGNPLIIAQVVWLLILFGLLYLILTAVALPRIGAVLEDRRGRIAADLTAAEAAKRAADDAAAEHRAATLKARAEAQAAVAAATNAAQADAARRNEALGAALDLRIRQAETRINASRDQAMGALREVSTDAAEAMVRRLVGRADRQSVELAVGRELSARGRA